MYSNGISTNETRSPMQAENPKAAKYLHKYKYTHTVHKLQI